MLRRGSASQYEVLTPGCGLQAHFMGTELVACFSDTDLWGHQEVLICMREFQNTDKLYVSGYLESQENKRQSKDSVQGILHKW